MEKIRALGVEQTQGVDTVEAFLLLGLPSPDLRTYEVAASVLLFERVKTVRLLTNNERKLKALSEYGIPTSPEALQLGEREFRELTQQMSNKELEHFAGYLQVKGTKLGQTLGLDFVHRILHDRGIDDAPPA